MSLAQRWRLCMAAREQQLELQMPAADSFWQQLKYWYHQQQTTMLYDRHLLLIMLALAAIGLVMVTSASMPVGERLTGNPFHFMLRHAVYLVLSLFTAVLVLTQPMSRWERAN